MNNVCEPTHFHLRSAAPCDRDALLVLYRGLIRAMEQLQPEDDGTDDALLLSWIDGALEGGSSHIIVAEADGGNLAGFTRVQAKSRPSDQDVAVQEPYAKLSDLYVSPDARRNGLAGRLMAEAERWAGDRALVRMVLNVYENNAAARKLYHSIGYRDQAAITLHRIRMVKELA
ncbi:MAG: GNAT family N-acetyltransferase [Eubacteriales bacterium]|nr:GNAT family N-acetyltransferase [Eubacteriales bacterium]